MGILRLFSKNQTRRSIEGAFDCKIAVRGYLQQPQPLPPPQMQERMRMSHTMSQLPNPPILPPQPQQLRSIKSKTMSHVLQPHPFVPFVKIPFMLCTSLKIRIAPTLPYATFEICVTEALNGFCINIFLCGSVEENDRTCCGIAPHACGVRLMLGLLQFGLKVVDCAFKTVVCAFRRLVYAVRRNELSVIGACNISPCGVQTYFSVHALFCDFGRCLHPFRICVFHAERFDIRTCVHVCRACHVLLTFHSLSHQRSENRPRIFADVPLQCLCLFVHPLHIYEQLKTAIFIY